MSVVSYNWDLLSPDISNASYHTHSKVSDVENPTNNDDMIEPATLVKILPIEG